LALSVLLFDVDLTLLATGGAGLKALSRALDEFHHDPAALEGISFAGKTDPLIFKEIAFNLGLGPDGLEDFGLLLKRRYLFHLEKTLAEAVDFELCPGVPGILDELKKHGVVLGLCTGNLEQGARLKLERGGIAGYFSFGGFGEHGPSRAQVAKAAVEEARRIIGSSAPAENIWIAGDTPLDINAARDTGVMALGVGTGYYTKDELLAHGADYAVRDLSEPGLVESLIGR